MGTEGRAAVNRGLIWGLGWVIAVGVFHFAVEILRAVSATPPQAYVGYVSLSRLTGVTGWCYWLAIPWLLVAAAIWLVRWRRRHEGVTRPTEVWAFLFVLAGFILASWAWALSRAEHIRIFY